MFAKIKPATDQDSLLQLSVHVPAQPLDLIGYAAYKLSTAVYFGRINDSLWPPIIAVQYFMQK